MEIASKLPNTTAIEAFLATAEHGSFTHAAKALNRTAGALSQQIKSLETMAGVELFHRATKSRGISLTPAGRRYYDRVRPIIFNLAPSHVNEDLPAVVNSLDFESALLTCHPDLREFWDKIQALDFDLSKDKVKTHAIKNQTLSFRPEGGQWVYNHIGRRTSYADFHGHKHCEKVIGLVASLRQPSGRFDSYDYEVSKAYNVVGITGEPNFSVVEGTIRRDDGVKERVEYERIGVRVWDGEKHIVLVRVVLRDSPEVSSVDCTNITRLDISEIDNLCPFLAAYLNDWRAGGGMWTRQPLSKYHDYAFVVRPQVTVNDSMVIAHIGEKHGSTLQFGKDWRMDHIGEMLDAYDPLGEEYVSETAKGYYECAENGEPNLSLLHSGGKLPCGTHSNIIYLRLLTRCHLSNGAAVVVNTASDVIRFGDRSKADSIIERILSGQYWTYGG